MKLEKRRITYDKILKGSACRVPDRNHGHGYFISKTLLEIWLTIAITLEPQLIILSCDGWLHLSTIPSCITEQITENTGIR